MLGSFTTPNETSDRSRKEPDRCCFLGSSWRPRTIWRGRGPSAACPVQPPQPSPFPSSLAGRQTLAQPGQTPTGCSLPRPLRSESHSHWGGSRVRGGSVYEFQTSSMFSEERQVVRWDDEKRRQKGDSPLSNDNVKGVAHSDEPTENYSPNLQLPLGFTELYRESSSLFSCLAATLLVPSHCFHGVIFLGCSRQQFSEKNLPAQHQVADCN